MGTFLSVIIPTCHRNDLLALCLQKLAPGEQTLTFDQYEVIVSDDGKNSTAEDMISKLYPWVKWVKGPGRGPAANRNHGAKQAQGEWLVFTDDDCLPEKDWLYEYTLAIKNNPETLAFEGAIHPDSWELLKKDMAECPVNTEGGCFWSANIAVERKLFQAIGGFDEDYLIAAQEDQDIFLQLKKYTIVVFIANSKVIHPVRFILLSSKLQKIKSQTYNYVKFLKKHHDLKEKGSSIVKKNILYALSHIKNDILSLKWKSLLFHIASLVLGHTFFIMEILKIKYGSSRVY